MRRNPILLGALLCTSYVAAGKAQDYAFRTTRELHVEVPASPSLNAYSQTQQMSFSLWFKPAIEAVNGMPIGKFAGSCADDFFLAFSGRTGSARLMLRNSRSCGGDQEISFASGLKPGVWAHIEFDWDFASSHVWVFVNGRLIGESATVGPTTANVIPMQLLAGIDGDVRNVHFSSVMRHTAQFAPPRRESPDANTIGFWPCNDGGGNIIHDVSANGNHGTVLGGAASESMWSSGPVPVDSESVPSSAAGTPVPVLATTVPRDSVSAAGKLSAEPTTTYLLIGAGAAASGLVLVLLYLINARARRARRAAIPSATVAAYASEEVSVTASREQPVVLATAPTPAPPTAANPASVSTLPTGASAHTDLVPCPFCAEPIRRGAIKCRYCREILPEQWAGSSDARTVVDAPATAAPASPEESAHLYRCPKCGLGFTVPLGGDVCVHCRAPRPTRSPSIGASPVLPTPLATKIGRAVGAVMGLLVFLWLWQLYGPTINPDTAKIEGMIQQQFPEAARVNCRSLGNDGFGGTRWGCKATVGGQRGPWFVGFHNSLGWNVREAYPDDRW